MQKAISSVTGLPKAVAGLVIGGEVPLETHQEILHYISWAAWLTNSLPCCKRTFEDLVERLVQTGPFFASLAKKDQNYLVVVAGTDLEGVAAALRPLLELLELLREPSLQLHLLLQQEEILKQAALLGGKVGSKVEDVLNVLQRTGVEIEHKAFKRAVNAAYQLQHVLYEVDDGDKDAVEKIKSLVQKGHANADTNTGSSEVPHIHGEPVQRLPDMLEKLAKGGLSEKHKQVKDNAEVKSICDKVAMGDLDPDSNEADFGNFKLKGPRKSRSSIAGVWTRPPPLALDTIIESPRVLWEVDTPTEFSLEDESSDSFRADVERTFAESASKVKTFKGKEEEKDPPPPAIQEVTGENESPEAMNYSRSARTPRRISFLPGQEGGERRESYLEGVQSPAQKSRRQSRRSYIASGEDAPWEYLCPITRELMVDPVTLSTGQTYDRAPITRWINSGHYTCPITGLPITNTDLVPNYALRHAIGRWADGHNIKLPEPESVPIQAQMRVTPTQRMLEWGQSAPAPSAPITKAVNRLYRGNSKEQETALRELCDFAKDGEEGRCNVAEAGAIPALIYMIQSGSLLAKELAAMCLRFLCRSTNTMVTQAASSSIRFLVGLLHEGTPDASEAAAGALVNLSAKNEVNKLTIAAAGAIPSLIRMLDATAEFVSFTTQEIAAAALCNLAVNQQNSVEISNEGAIPRLIQVVSDCPTPEAGEYACHALGSLSAENFENSKQMIEAGAADVLVAMAGPGTPWTQEAAARAIRNISYNESLRQPLVKAGAVQQLNALLEYSTPRAGDAAAAALWNLAPSGPKYFTDNLKDDSHKQKQQEDQEEKKSGKEKAKDVKA